MFSLYELPCLFTEIKTLREVAGGVKTDPNLNLIWILARPLTICMALAQYPPSVYFLTLQKIQRPE